MIGPVHMMGPHHLGVQKAKITPRKDMSRHLWDDVSSSSRLTDVLVTYVAPFHSEPDIGLQLLYKAQLSSLLCLPIPDGGFIRGTSRWGAGLEVKLWEMLVTYIGMTSGFAFLCTLSEQYI